MRIRFINLRFEILSQSQPYLLIFRSALARSNGVELLVELGLVLVHTITANYPVAS